MNAEDKYKIRIAQLGEKTDIKGARNFIGGDFPRAFPQAKKVMIRTRNIIKGPSFFRGSKQKLETQFGFEMLKLRQALVCDTDGLIGISKSYTAGFFCLMSDYMPDWRDEYRMIESRLSDYYLPPLNDDDTDNRGWGLLKYVGPDGRGDLIITFGEGYPNGKSKMSRWDEVINCSARKVQNGFGVGDYFAACEVNEVVIGNIYGVEFYEDGRKLLQLVPKQLFEEASEKMDAIDESFSISP